MILLNGCALGQCACGCSLATDLESVARQLFETLCIQLVHWFTSYNDVRAAWSWRAVGVLPLRHANSRGMCLCSRQGEKEETMALLNATVDGCGSDDAGLRDFSAR